jgi:3-oxoacyl-[acyl-carrier protein] reductase
VLLENKTAVIYGGSGAVGSAVAHAFAGEGAKVFLAGRDLAKVQAVADAINAGGGRRGRRKWMRSTSRPSVST